MTLEELAEWTSDRIKALTDKELTELCSTYFEVTRPELAVKPDVKSSKEREVKQQNLASMSSQQRAALAMLAEEGVDMSFLSRRKKK